MFFIQSVIIRGSIMRHSLRNYHILCSSVSASVKHQHSEKTSFSASICSISISLLGLIEIDNVIKKQTKKRC